MLKVSKEAREVMFYLMAMQTVCWPSGRILVRAGTVGAAVLRWEGPLPGYFIEWEGGSSCGMLENDEGRAWTRVAGFRMRAACN